MITRSELEIRIADMLGYGRDSDKWSDLMLDRLSQIIDKAYQEYIHPPSIGDGNPPHAWGWLRDTYWFTTVVNEPYYNMPSNFGFTISPPYFNDEERYYSTQLNHVGWQKLHYLQNAGARADTGLPVAYAINTNAPTIQDPSTSSSASWDEDCTLGSVVMGLFPTPDKAYKLVVEYEKSATTFLRTPLGPNEMGLLLEELCLGTAEIEMNDAPGIHYQRYLQLLERMIVWDRRVNPTPVSNLGSMRDAPENNQNDPMYDPRLRRAYNISITHSNQ